MIEEEELITHFGSFHILEEQKSLFHNFEASYLTVKSLHILSNMIVSDTEGQFVVITMMKLGFSLSS